MTSKIYDENRFPAEDIKIRLSEVHLTEDYSDLLHQARNQPTMNRYEVWEEYGRLKQEGEGVRNQVLVDDETIAEIACMDELRTCRKVLENMILDSLCNKKKLEELEATILKKNKTIKLLEGRVKDYKDWSEEVSQDRDKWVNRAEDLEGEVEAWRQTVQCLKQRKGLVERQCDTLTEDMETILQGLNEIENSGEVNEATDMKALDGHVQQSFDEAVNQKLEKFMADDGQVQEVAERIKRNLTMSDSTKIVLEAQQEINRRLADSLDEERRIFKERNERIEQLQDMMRERDIQIMDMKNEASKREREERLSNGDKSSSILSIHSL